MAKVNRIPRKQNVLLKCVTQNKKTKQRNYVTKLKKKAILFLLSRCKHQISQETETESVEVLDHNTISSQCPELTNDTAEEQERDIIVTRDEDACPDVTSYTVTSDDSVTSKPELSSEDKEPPTFKTFYHYTDDASATSIMNDMVIKARSSINGSGVYFTILDPRNNSKDRIARNNYNNGGQYNIARGKVDKAIKVTMPDNHPQYPQKLGPSVVGSGDVWKCNGDLPIHDLTPEKINGPRY